MYFASLLSITALSTLKNSSIKQRQLKKHQKKSIQFQSRMNKNKESMMSVQKCCWKMQQNFFRPSVVLTKNRTYSLLLERTLSLRIPSSFVRRSDENWTDFKKRNGELLYS
ncbi:hypothetical protein CEXT_499631 [Caerostris extrusa]|uniref:Uncharacterized protein n=1 Tax=Caerostris extrusa TaxID=172846 RepID=A0AAV4WM10_CAEEX|nr:hypothetical protein CEXT_499631 [Caerostris extrusa]